MHDQRPTIPLRDGITGGGGWTSLLELLANAAPTRDLI